MREKIVLIDGNSIINRAYYGIPLLSNKNGQYTNGVYGFLNILFKIIDEETPKYLAVAFDLPGKNFRHEKFSEYKGTRKGMPDELASQMPVLKDLLTKMNIKIFEMSGYEADDVLGTLSVIGEKESLQPVIVSGDRDMLQLATDTVKIRIPKTKGGKTEIEDYFAKDVEAKYEVNPTEFIEVKGLMGDTSDNVPGVPGIGEKTAIKIIKEYKSIDNALNNISNMKQSKVVKNLDEFREQALMSKMLVTIIKDVPIEFNLDEVSLNNIYNDEAFDMISELELKTLFKRFDNNNVDKKPVAKVNYKLIDDPFSSSDAVEELLKKDIVSFNIFHEDDIMAVTFNYEVNNVIIFLVGDGFTVDTIIEEIKPIFTSNIKKVSSNYKEDIKILKEKNIELNNVVMDLMLASYVLNPSKSSYGYEVLALEFLGETHQSLEEILGKGKSKINLSSLGKEKLLELIAIISDVNYRAFTVIEEKIAENDQADLLYNIEIPLAEVLADMESEGITVLTDMLKEFGKELDLIIDQLKEKILELAGEDFNINSPSQLGEILFEKLGLVSSKKTKTGYSTRADVLEKLIDKHEIIQHVIDYRTYTKLKSTYVEGLLNVVDIDTSKIYSTFNQTVTTTGRISSTEPNLQNIPIKLDFGRKLRKVFVPKSDDYIFLDADYSQIELRVLAHISEDETLIQAFKDGVDIHALTASQVFHVPLEEVESYQRSYAKAVNFGIIYGISGFSLSQDLKITKKEADRYIKGYFEKYPKVKTYLDKTVEDAKETGYGITICGRRRNIPEINSSNFNVKGFGERIAMNMPIQGSAADIIKIAMVKVYKRLKNENLKSKLILQVHDELLIETKKDEVDKVREILITEMENAYKMLVPLEVDVHQGHNWYQLK